MIEFDYYSGHLLIISFAPFDINFKSELAVLIDVNKLL
jgi:hypothetical protein